MKNTARIIALLLIQLTAFVNIHSSVLAAYQQCDQGETCTVGEFLYDDSYVPVATGACTLTSRYPDGSLFINSASMSATSDGWYSYPVEATGSAGLYRSQVCCTVGSDYLCLDKSFMVATASSTLTTTNVSDAVWNASRSAYTASGSFGEALQVIVPSTTQIADAVWDHSSRTLSGFGTLIADIWSYSTRSLTDFGTLAADVWSYTTRTLTGAGLSDGGSLATTSDIQTATQSAVATIKGSSNKDLTDISNEVANLQSDATSIKSTVEETKTVVDLIAVDTGNIRDNVDLLLLKWGSMDIASISGRLDTVNTKIGTTSDTESESTVFGRIEYIRNKWGSQTAQTIYDQALAAYNTISLVQTELNYNGKSTTAYQDLQRVIAYVDSLEGSIGTSTDAATTSTLFGRMKKVQDKVDLLTGIDSDIDTILSKWGSYTFSDIYDKVDDLEDQLGAVSSTNITSILNQTNSNTSAITSLKNEILTVKAIAQVNRDMLEKIVNKPIIKTFLLEGSVIFKSLIINPSERISQKAQFVYYLPAEVKKEDILEYDKELTIEFDTEKNQLVAKGEFNLAASETKTVSVRVQDIWNFSDEEIGSLRKQAEQLYQPLVKTSYFGQGVTIKSDIDVALDKIVEAQKAAVTPESKIKTYHESQIEIKGIKTKIDKLKELVAAASSAGSLAGFVGGAQAIAVWGIIIIMITGFVFLVLYMRVLKVHEVTPAQSQSVVIPPLAIAKVATNYRHGEVLSRHHHIKRLAKLSILLIAFGVVSSSVSSAVMYKFMTFSKASQNEEKKVQQNAIVLGKQTDNLLCHNQVKQEEEPKKVVSIILPDAGFVNLREEATTRSDILTKITTSQTAQVMEEEDGWVKVSINVKGGQESIEGWVKKEFTKDAATGFAPKAGPKKITIKYDINELRVRKDPNGQIIAKVKAGETFTAVGEEDEWVQITLTDGSKGWIAKEYSFARSSALTAQVP